ncbi:MAG: rhodanese-related sulfurtransferase [Candidatus Pacebacteria bacterium]|nr:rhodanese-related sulfurtransferase [Candidatus Paceibacterota bacterium]MCF7863134.1 rhodanese-related sulfurtransferase [Candidatus Paceibacterota bacterium]
MENQKYEVLLYYKYVKIEDPASEKLKQKKLCEDLNLKGRIIVATEGINGTVEGLEENTQKYIDLINDDPKFKDIHWKRSTGTGKAFPKLSVKERKEIVSLHLGETCDIDPNEVTGIHLKPEELHSWLNIEKKEFYIIDMRNIYEHKVGYFENSVLPSLNNFRDLPNLVKELQHLKDKVVVTVCTGGVRCEKASGFLITQGFKNVYQLDGGIVSYMEKYPNENFKGKLYVFDNRITQGFYTDDPKHEIIGVCNACGEKSERYINCANNMCHRHFIACGNCEKTKGEKVLCPDGCTLSRRG